MNNDYLGMVGDFHLLFNAPILPTPQIPSTERCNLRINLMQEELDEIKEAIENNDLVEVADGLCDLMYVLCGTIHEFGLGEKFNELFNEVQRSNMSKACENEVVAQETIEHYKQKDGTESDYKEVNGKYIVYRNEDNKVLKSVNYSPANLPGIIKGVDTFNMYLD
jgi:predicted HAD superfamily Cof-like phosphohydrolase